MLRNSQETSQIQIILRLQLFPSVRFQIPTASETIRNTFHNKWFAVILILPDDSKASWGWRKVE